MEWTTNIPTTCGYYWAVWDGLVYMVSLDKPPWDTDRIVAYFLHSDEYVYIDNPDRHEFTNWMGPLEEPEKPE